MEKPLNFQLRLTDMFSPKLAPVVRSLGDAGKAFDTTKLKVDELERKLNKAGGGRGFFTFDLATGLNLAWSATQRLAGGFTSLVGKITHVAAATQDLNLAVRLSFGDARAREVQELADLIADRTRLDDDEVKQFALGLKNAGVKDQRTLGDILTVATDIATRLNDPAAVGGVVDTFRKLALKDGEVGDQLLRTLQLTEKQFFSSLARYRGVSEKTARALAKAGKFSGDDMIQAAIRARAASQGGAIGGPAREAEKTIGTTLARLRNATGSMFKRIAEGPGMRAVQRAIDSVTKALTGDAGAAFIRQIDEILKSVGEWITPARIDEIANKVTSFLGDVRDAWPDIKSGAMAVWSVFRAIGQAAMYIARQVQGVLETVETGRESFRALTGGGVSPELVQRMLRRRARELAEERARALGPDAGEFPSALAALGDPARGFAALDAVKKVAREAGVAMGGEVEAGVRDSLEIRSPSKVMTRLGVNAAEGFARGLTGGTADVSAAARRAIGGTTEATIPLAARGSAPTISFGDIHLHVDRVEGDAAEQGRAMAQAFRVEAARLFRQLGYQTGAAQGAE